MSFQSFTFAAFLAAAVGGFYAVPKKGRLAVLLIFNILFFEWADPFAGIWLLSSVCLTWGCALLVEKGADRTKRRLLIGACLSFQLILLAVFKYLPVWNEIINKWKRSANRSSGCCSEVRTCRTHRNFVLYAGSDRLSDRRFEGKISCGKKLLALCGISLLFSEHYERTDRAWRPFSGTA